MVDELLQHLRRTTLCSMLLYSLLICVSEYMCPRESEVSRKFEYSK